MFTQEEIKNAFNYDPLTGVFTNKVRRGKATVGKVSGHIHSSGYRILTFKGKKLRAHRVAWLYTYGEWPKSEIDHTNNIKDDNRITNLRDATQVQNKANRRKTTSNTSSVYKGVSWYSRDNKWRAAIKHEGKSIHLGYFKEEIDAATAYNIAAEEYQKEFAVLNT